MNQQLALEEEIEVAVVEPSHEKTVKVKPSDIVSISHESHNGEDWGYFFETNWKRVFVDRETALLLCQVTGKELIQHTYQTKRFGDDTELHHQKHEWLEECKAKEENWAYVDFDAEIEVDVYTKEIKAHASINETVERPFKPEGDSFGGMWGSGGIGSEKVGEELKSDILNFKRNRLESPYKKGINSHLTFNLRDTRAENIRLFITEAGKEYLKLKGVSPDELQKEFGSMPENVATDKDIFKSELYGMVEGEKEKIEEELRVIDDSLRSKLKFRGEYSGITPKCADRYENTPLQELADLKLKLMDKLEILETTYEEFRNDYWGKTTFDMSEERVNLLFELFGK